MRRAVVVVLASAVAATLGLAADLHEARADASAADVAAARTLAAEGIKLAKAGKCEGAVEKLDRAERLFHAPSTLARLGECHVEIGRLVLGTEELRRVVREPLAADAPKAFVNAKARAERVLEKAQPRIPYVKIALTAPSGVKPETTLDGDVLSSAAIGTEWPVDPGEHTIEAAAPGYLRASAKVTLKEAEKRDVTLTLVVDPNAKPVVATPAPSANGEASRAASGPTAPGSGGDTGASEPSRMPVYAAFGVGAAGLAVGGVAGVIFLKHASDLSSSCPDKTCSTAHADDLSTTKTWGTVSTIGFAVGAVGVAAGFILLFTSGRSASSPDRASVTPVLGLGSAGVAGRF